MSEQRSIDSLKRWATPMHSGCALIEHRKPTVRLWRWKPAEVALSGSMNSAATRSPLTWRKLTPS